jgi:6-pyruvoyltetrahydropterin/6-carboxytetrahydropterin synthase
MIVAVRKTFQFHAAHQIPHHPGECRNLHGHTYTVVLEARGPIQTNGDEEGMVIDFGDLKRIYSERIHSICDHAYLNDVFPFPTTAENLAQHFAVLLHGLDDRLVAVEVSEGPGNVARAEIGAAA